jgi:hypothetical protein
MLAARILNPPSIRKQTSPGVAGRSAQGQEQTSRRTFAEVAFGPGADRLSVNFEASRSGAPTSTCTAERAEPLKCLGGQLRGKLTCGKLSTECRSLSGV